MRRIACLILFTVSLSAGPAAAQELEPRFYTNLPVGLNFLAVGYGRSEGSVLVDPSIELQNADLTVDGPFIGYARSLGIGRLSGKFDAGVANVCLEGSADFEGERVSRAVCGWSDARMRLSVNFIGAPALSLKDFASYDHDLVVGASLQLIAPVGDYDADRLVNIGTNRWAAKAELGASEALRRWLLELTLSSTWLAERQSAIQCPLRSDVVNAGQPPPFCQDRCEQRCIDPDRQ